MDYSCQDRCGVENEGVKAYNGGGQVTERVME
jgi:hypothetical protein